MNKCLSFAAAALLLFSSVAHAQSTEPARSVGRKGATQLGLNFATTTAISDNGLGGTSATTNLFGGVDIGRFVTNKFLLRFGVSGFGEVGGSAQPSYGAQSSGGSTVTFTFLTGGLFYVTPQKAQSLYLGGDMSIPMSKNGSSNPYVNGRVGVQAAIRANASFFVEAGYGAQISSGNNNGLSSGSNGSFQTNLGVRVLF
jgi:hypothetical protein